MSIALQILGILPMQAKSASIPPLPPVEPEIDGSITNPPLVDVNAPFTLTYVGLGFKTNRRPTGAFVRNDITRVEYQGVITSSTDIEVVASFASGVPVDGYEYAPFIRFSDSQDAYGDDTFEVYAPPVVTSLSFDPTPIPPATFTVDVVGSNLTYDWQISYIRAINEATSYQITGTIVGTPTSSEAFVTFTGGLPAGDYHLLLEFTSRGAVVSDSFNVGPCTGVLVPGNENISRYDFSTDGTMPLAPVVIGGFGFGIGGVSILSENFSSFTLGPLGEQQGWFAQAGWPNPRVDVVDGGIIGMTHAISLFDTEGPQSTTVNGGTEYGLPTTMLQGRSRYFEFVFNVGPGGIGGGNPGADQMYVDLLSGPMDLVNFSTDALSLAFYRTGGSPDHYAVTIYDGSPNSGNMTVLGEVERWMGWQTVSIQINPDSTYRMFVNGNLILP